VRSRALVRYRRSGDDKRSRMPDFCPTPARTWATHGEATFEDQGWEDRTSWLKADPKTLAHLNNLVEGTLRDATRISLGAAQNWVFPA